jgi:hypothetical protein
MQQRVQQSECKDHFLCPPISRDEELSESSSDGGSSSGVASGFRQWPWGANKILRPRNRPIIVTARFDRVKHLVNVERDEPSVDRNYS